MVHGRLPQGLAAKSNMQSKRAEVPGLLHAEQAELARGLKPDETSVDIKPKTLEIVVPERIPIQITTLIWRPLLVFSMTIL